MRPQSEEEALLHQNIWISDVWVCPSVSSHWLQPLARALAFWNNFQMNTTMPFPRLTTLFSLLGYVAINSHSQVLSLAIYSELISRLISLREIFYFQILGRRLTETNTTPVTQWLFPFHGFPFPFLGPLEPLLWLSLLMYICYELDLLGGALSASLNLCSFVLRPLFRAL